MIVVQYGARNHYAAARGFYHHGQLTQLYTDVWIRGTARRLSEMLRHRSSIAASLLGRHVVDIPDSKVLSFNVNEYSRRLRFLSRASLSASYYLPLTKAFLRQCASRLPKSLDPVYCLDDATEVFAGSNGRRKILEQVGCMDTYFSLRHEEQQRWPRWEVEHPEEESGENEVVARSEYCFREADTIIAPSEYVRQDLLSKGVSSDKIRLVSYWCDSPVREPKEYAGDRPLRVLFVGYSNLMKGLPYLLASIKGIPRDQVSLRCVGHVNLRDEILQEYSEVEFTGRLPREWMANQFTWADVFILPSLCEGSSLAIYEALSYGCPVITTPNSGSIVRDGIEGIIVPIRASGALANAIGRYVNTPELVRRMSAAALDLAHRFTLDRYWEALVSAVLQ